MIGQVIGFWTIVFEVIVGTFIILFLAGYVIDQARQRAQLRKDMEDWSIKKLLAYTKVVEGNDSVVLREHAFRVAQRKQYKQHLDHVAERGKSV